MEPTAIEARYAEREAALKAKLKAKEDGKAAEGSKYAEREAALKAKLKAKEDAKVAPGGRNRPVRAQGSRDIRAKSSGKEGTKIHAAEAAYQGCEADRATLQARVAQLEKKLETEAQLLKSEADGRVGWEVKFIQLQVRLVPSPVVVSSLVGFHLRVGLQMLYDDHVSSPSTESDIQELRNQLEKEQEVVSVGLCALAWMRCELAAYC